MKNKSFWQFSMFWSLCSENYSPSSQDGPVKLVSSQLQVASRGNTRVYTHVPPLAHVILWHVLPELPSVKMSHIRIIPLWQYLQKNSPIYLLFIDLLCLFCYGNLLNQQWNLTVFDFSLCTSRIFYI